MSNTEQVTEQVEVESQDAEQTDDPVSNGHGGEGEENSQADPAAELARELGWKPRDEWRGDVPDTFADSPVDYLKQLKNKNRRTAHENRTLAADLEVVKQHMEDVKRQHKQEMEAKREELRRVMREAVDEADGQKYDNAQKQLGALEKQAEQPKAQPQRQNPDNMPGFREWHADNPWYGTDRDRTEFAESIAVKRVMQSGLTPQAGRAYYDAIAREVNRVMPMQSQRQTENGGTETNNKPRKGWDALPQEARDTFSKTLVRRGIYQDTKEDRAEYARSYQENAQ